MNIKALIEKIVNNPLYVTENNHKKRQKGNARWIPSLIPALVILSFPGFLILHDRLTRGRATTNDVYPYIILMWLSAFLGLYFIFKTCFAAYNQFASELDRKTYPLLISTLMRPNDIILGKFLPVFIPVFRDFSIYTFLTLSLLIVSKYETQLLIWTAMFFAAQFIVIVTSIFMSFILSLKNSKPIIAFIKSLAAIMVSCWFFLITVLFESNGNNIILMFIGYILFFLWVNFSNYNQTVKKLSTLPEK